MGENVSSMPERQCASLLAGSLPHYSSLTAATEGGWRELISLNRDEMMGKFDAAPTPPLCPTLLMSVACMSLLTGGSEGGL